MCGLSVIEAKIVWRLSEAHRLDFEFLEFFSNKWKQKNFFGFSFCSFFFFWLEENWERKISQKSIGRSRIRKHWLICFVLLFIIHKSMPFLFIISIDYVIDRWKLIISIKLCWLFVRLRNGGDDDDDDLDSLRLCSNEVWCTMNSERYLFRFRLNRNRMFSIRMMYTMMSYWQWRSTNIAICFEYPSDDR